MIVSAVVVCEIEEGGPVASVKHDNLASRKDGGARVEERQPEGTISFLFNVRGKVEDKARP